MASTLDWYGCATFRLRTAGLTIFLDAYVDRVEGAPGTGLTAGDITDGCDWIVVGHSHFDHLWGAERLLANHPHARLIAGYESVRVMEQAGIPLERMICVAGGETVDLGHGVRVSVYPSQHSCVWSHRQMHGADEVCLGDLGVTWQEQQARMRDVGAYLATSLGPATGAHLRASAPGHSNRGDGGALVFLFETPDGSLLYQDTSGHWSGVLGMLRPDVAILAAAGRGNVDGEPVQGSLAGFVARQVELVRPRTLVLSHHDDWLPGFSVPTDVGPIRTAVEAVAPDITLLELGYLDGTDPFV